MTTIRGLMLRDLAKVEKIHSEFYKHEFPIEDLNRCLTSFAVVDEEDEVICAGGIRPIIEAIIVTDKDVEIAKRREALIKMLQIAEHTTSRSGYRQMHAFVQDENWARHLVRYGFKSTVGRSLVINV